MSALICASGAWLLPDIRSSPSSVVVRWRVLLHLPLFPSLFSSEASNWMRARSMYCYCLGAACVRTLWWMQKNSWYNGGAPPVSAFELPTRHHRPSRPPLLSSCVLDIEAQGSRFSPCRVVARGDARPMNSRKLINVWALPWFSFPSPFFKIRHFSHYVPLNRASVTDCLVVRLTPSALFPLKDESGSS